MLIKENATVKRFANASVKAVNFVKKRNPELHENVNNEYFL